MTTPKVRSIADVAEGLMREFEAVLGVSAVTEVVMRLSRNGDVSLDALAAQARRELANLMSNAHGTRS